MAFEDIINDLIQQTKDFSNKDFSDKVKQQGNEIDNLLSRPALNEQTQAALEDALNLSLEKDKQPEAFEDVPDDLTLEEAKAQLESLIGLEEIKGSIKSLVKRLEGQHVLQTNSKIKIGNPNLHMIYSGPPGTGKTEVARIVAKILHLLGYIKTNNVVETDRSGLVGDYAGATAQKVMKKVNEALDGVLFIDEAYALANGDGYGKEAIDTLIKALEDYRGRFVVILAGYEAEMDKLINENPGFKSRIPHRYHFKDYTPKELTRIANKMLEDKGYVTNEVMDMIENIIKLESKNGTLEGNARTVRNLVERIVQHHMIRVGEELPKDLETVHVEDVRKAAGLDVDSTVREGMDIIQKEAIDKLDGLVGLDPIKKEVKRLLNFFAIQQKKRSQGIPTPLPDMNMIFTGDSGTGKTEVARIIGEILKGNGVLSNGHLKEVSRADLVGNVVGDTAQKVKRVVAESLGGILFIDRAYALYSNDSYSAEAIDTLVKEMDDNKGNLVVILAGYEGQMNEMLEGSEGLKSRFRYHFNFENYNPEEIFHMTKMQLDSMLFAIEEDTLSFLLEEMKQLNSIESNGRWASEFVERLQIIQSDRLIKENSSDFLTITHTDVEETLKDM